MLLFRVISDQRGGSAHARWVKPVYVSIGHRVCLDAAIELTLACVSCYRLPETTRHAHHLASAKKDGA